MTDIPPLDFQWDGEAMRPHRKGLADKHYVVGENYRLAPTEHRSVNSHNHYFAAIHEAFMNLPESMADRFATEDHLRRYALIKAGFRDERSIACASKAEARKIGAFIKPLDDYAVVVVRDNVVIVYTAKSQSYRSMPKAEFQRSKDEVLRVLAEMIGTPQSQLEKAQAA